MKIFDPYKVNESSRGLFYGIVNIGIWQEINYIETKANQARGNHYHKLSTELFFIIEGEIDVEVKSIKGEIINNFRAIKGSIFLIEPFEIHIFKCRSDCKWINIMSNKINDNQCDIYKE